MLTRLFPAMPLSAAALVLAGAAAGPAAAEPAVLNGEAAYRERMAPPPDAELVVQIRRIEDGEEHLVSESRQALSAVPAEFSVPYDTADVDPVLDYAAVAWIESDGRVLWRTAEPHPVLVDGATVGVDLQLKRVLSNVAAPVSASETQARSEEDSAEAEAPDPVTEAPAATEAEAESNVEATGAAVVAPPAGASTARPPAEGESALAATGAGASVAPASDADDATASAGGASQGLAGTWRVEDIGGTGVVDASRTEITFDGNGRASGVGGCNRFTGGVELGEDDALSFGPMAATRMACVPALMEQEQKFFAALDAVRSWRIEEPFLFLADEDGEDLVKLIRADE